MSGPEGRSSGLARGEPAARSGFSGWLASHVPTREGLEQNRMLRPFAHRLLRAELWRFTRRSVPRGVALGLLIGVTIPFAHSVIAALLAVAVGANVPVAFATTWVVSNPLTLPFLLWSAWRIGHFLRQIDVISGLGGWLPGHAAGGWHHHHGQAAHGAAGLARHPMLHRLASAGLNTACGLAVEGLVLAALGYVAASLVWRWRVGRQWRARGRRRAHRP